MNPSLHCSRLFTVVALVLLLAAPVAAQAGDYGLQDNQGNNYLLVLENGGTGYLGAVEITWQKVGNDVWVWDPVSGVIFNLVGAGGGVGNGALQDSGGGNVGTWQSGIG